MNPGEFWGRLPGLEVTDSGQWPEKWNDKRTPGPDNHRRLPHDPVAVRNGPYKPEYAFPSRVTLTKREKEWLGVAVRLPDGLAGQVWSLGYRPGYLWVAIEGKAHHVRAADVVRLP